MTLFHTDRYNTPGSSGSSDTLIYETIPKTANQTLLGSTTVDIADLTYTVTQAGKYEISYTFQAIMSNLTGSAVDFFIADASNTNLGGNTRFQWNLLSAAANGDQIYGTEILDLNVGDVVKVRANNISSQSCTISAVLNQSKLIIKQLPSGTLVSPDLLTPTILDRVVARISSDFSNSTANNAFQVYPFDVASHNPNGNFNTTTFSYTVPADGDYRTDLVLSYINNSSTSDDRMEIAIRLNGTSTVLQLNHDASDLIGSASTLSQTLSGIIPGLVAGDVLTAEFFDADDVLITMQDGTSWSIEQLPTASVIMPGTITPAFARMNRNTTALSVPESGTTDIIMQSTAVDTTGIADPDNDRFVIGTSGVYLATCKLALSDSGAGIKFWSIRLMKNVSTLIEDQGVRRTGNTGNVFSSFTFQPIQLSAGDTVSLEATYTDLGGSSPGTVVSTGTFSLVQLQ